MAQATAIRLTGDDLRIGDVWEVAIGEVQAALSDEARTKMRAARELVERAAHGSREHTYGINTGFGRFVSQSIPEEQTEELQLRLLRSHACGVGDPYPEEIVRAAMLLRANALAKGNSGARVDTVELLLECLGRGVMPRASSRRGWLQRKASRSSTARSSWPRTEPSASSGRGGSRRPRTSRARSRSRRCRGRARASSRRSSDFVPCEARVTPRRMCSGCSRARRSTRRTG